MYGSTTSTYQKIERVRSVLRDSGLDVAAHEEDGSLVIVDSVVGFIGPEVDVLSLLKILTKQAQNRGRGGCFAFSDVGSFYAIGKERELLKYEASMPLKFDWYNGFLNCKGFCAYHEKDFNRLAEDEKQSIFEHHYRNLIIN